MLWKPRMIQNDADATELLSRLQTVMVEIDRFCEKADPTKRRLSSDVSWRMGLLLDWADHHRSVIEEFPKWNDATLDFRVPRPHPGLILNAVSASRGLKPKNGFTPRALAVISLLAGNLPINDRRLARKGYTVATIIDLETKHIRKVDTQKKLKYVQPSAKVR